MKLFDTWHRNSRVYQELVNENARLHLRTGQLYDEANRQVNDFVDLEKKLREYEVERELLVNKIWKLQNAPRQVAERWDASVNLDARKTTKKSVDKYDPEPDDKYDPEPELGNTTAKPVKAPKELKPTVNWVPLTPAKPVLQNAKPVAKKKTTKSLKSVKESMLKKRGR